jgi:glutamyl-tRNA reductase
MNLLVIGLSHRTAPVEVRERLAIPRSRLGEASRELREATGLHEVTILSTCNRVEIYGLGQDTTAASAAVRRFLCEHHQLNGSVDAHLYELHDRECALHLWEVVCGLDSMVLGETEILGQTKAAYQAACEAGATGVVLNRLFQKAFAAAKHIRSSTAIARGSTSVGNVAVDLAEKIFRDLAPCTVMVIGTGEISETTAKALRSRGAGGILVCSRSPERAQAFATQMGGQAISYDDWPEHFPKVDIVIAAAGAPHPIVTTDKLRPLLAQRTRPLFLIDIAVPRNVEPACGEMEDVFLYDIDDLQQMAQQNLAAREREIAACRSLLTDRLVHFTQWLEQRSHS